MKPLSIKEIPKNFHPVKGIFKAKIFNTLKFDRFSVFYMYIYRIRIFGHFLNPFPYSPVRGVSSNRIMNFSRIDSFLNIQLAAKIGMDNFSTAEKSTQPCPSSQKTPFLTASK